MYRGTILSGLAVIIFALLSLRTYDKVADQLKGTRLLSTQPINPSKFDQKLVAHLPEPARRYFNFVIEPGAVLYTVAQLEMQGQFSFGSKEEPNYQPMSAAQILAMPAGFLWRLEVPGVVPISGSDSESWTRFRILGLIPVARQGGGENHRRAAFGRYVAEAVFWTPAALLPSDHVSWEMIGKDAARVTVKYEGLSQEVDVEVDPQGKPFAVHFMRWSNANPEKVFRLQPFGGDLRDFREVQGFRLPFEVDAGNQYGTPEYFPFYKARLTKIQFPNG